ncbi:MAG: clan AA aspartic protease [Magnetococcales bacterium]|nr:clan AA aspartic protease [Magnetococcales bacterium]
MGLIHADLVLKNPLLDSTMVIRAMVDSGALLMCIPQHVAMQLQLKELEKREVTLADGHRHLVPYVGPLEIHFANRRCFAGALVLGHEPLLGAVPMEDMDIVINMAQQKLVVNPENPHIAMAPVKTTA